MNEEAVLQFIQQHTNIPVPKLYCCFEDDQAVFLVTEYVEGVGMDDLENSQREIIRDELKKYLETLQRVCGLQGSAALVASWSFPTERH